MLLIFKAYPCSSSGRAMVKSINTVLNAMTLAVPSLSDTQPPSELVPQDCHLEPAEAYLPG